MDEKIVKLWRDKATQKFSFVETDEDEYQLFYSQKHGYLYEKNHGNAVDDSNEIVDLSMLVNGKGVPITSMWDCNGYDGLADFLDMSQDDSEECLFCFCAICDDYSKEYDDITECEHLFLSNDGEWRGSGDTEHGDCPYDDYLKGKILKFAEVTGCKAELIEALKHPDDFELMQISGSWVCGYIDHFVINRVDYEMKANHMLNDDKSLAWELSDGWGALVTLAPQYYGVILEFLIKSEAQS